MSDAYPMPGFATLAACHADLALCVARYAQRLAVRRRVPTWSVVAEILGAGSTTSIRFCVEHLPLLGWKRVSEAPPPEDQLVYTSEDLGDHPRKLKRVDGAWFDAREEQMMYVPTWWKEIP